jgi:serine/threonine protein kinase
MSFDTFITTGTTIKGKWKQASYRVERSLGEGANGKVYLVKKGSVFFAMKLGFDTVDHQSEVNVLHKLSRGEGAFSRYLIDVDDFHVQGKDYPFYVMKYVRGIKIADFVQIKGEQWLGLLGLHLLKKLIHLHAQDYIFGDIKIDNILVSGYAELELVDFGGVTQKGRSVKQFTEIYDRGYWGAGSRIADEAYDLFAFAVLIMQLSGQAQECFSKHLLPQNRTVELLKEKLLLEPNKELHAFAPFISKALDGGYSSSREAYHAWKDLFYSRNRLLRPKTANGKTYAWVQAGFVVSVIVGLSVWYFYL